MITVVQQYDREYEKIARLTTENKSRFADKHSHRFVDYFHELEEGDAWYWHNTLGILKAIHDTRVQGEWLFWTDVDSLIMNEDFDLTELTSQVDDDVQIIASFWCLPTNSLLDNLDKDIRIIHSPGSGRMFQIHTGNFLVRRTEKAVALLQRIYEDHRFRERPEIIIPGSGDEAAYAIYYMGYPSLRKYFHFCSPSVFCTVPEESLEFIRYFNMNRYMNIPMYKSGDFILHALGRWESLESIAEWKYNVLKKWIV